MPVSFATPQLDKACDRDHVINNFYKAPNAISRQELLSQLASLEEAYPRTTSTFSNGKFLDLLPSVTKSPLKNKTAFRYNFQNKNVTARTFAQIPAQDSSIAVDLSNVLDLEGISTSVKKMNTDFP